MFLTLNFYHCMLRNVCKDSIRTPTFVQVWTWHGKEISRCRGWCLTLEDPNMISTLTSSANGKSPKQSPPSHLDWWMETIHVYTISGWSKLVEKWESKSFIFKGEQSWDDISFSWYQRNAIKADIWPTSWQNGTLKKQTSSTITVYALSFTKHDFQDFKQYNNVPDLQKPQEKHANNKGNMCWIRPTIWMADLVTPLRICHPGSVITRMS